MNDTPDTQSPAYAEALAATLHGVGVLPTLAPEDLTIASTKGVSHDHWHIAATGLVLRVPRLSQWGMDAGTQLAYEATAFKRAEACGHCPGLHSIVTPAGALPRGALIVSRIDGHPPVLPDDSAAIADALAALHSLPVPSAAAQAPLQTHRAPIAATLAVIEEQAVFIADAGLAPEASLALEDELAWARRLSSLNEPDFALCLVGTDTHPGNFLIDATGKAWFVDLEKALYGAAPIDLAHASLTPSIGWDPDVSGALSPDDVAAFYSRYLERVGSTRAEELRPWLQVLRRLTWLRTMTWFARWQAAWSRGDHPASRDAAMTAHIRGHIARCFASETIRAAQAVW